MKKLILTKNTLGGIELAMGDASFESDWYLDTENGELRMFGPDIPDFDNPPGENAPDWIKEEHAKKVEVENDVAGRFLYIPTTESWEGWQDMADFIATVEDTTLRERLDAAIRGRGAFRRFQDKVAEHPAEHDRWYAFERTRTHERIRDWLAAEGFELVVAESEKRQ